MIIGIVLFIAGLVVSFWGSTKFHFGIVATGWVMSSGGVALFVAGFLSWLLGVHLI